MRYEGSLVTSLAELRAIEEQRIAAERAAIVHAETERVLARDRAAAQALAVEEARIVAEREAALAIERERERAEREARMHVEAAEATERARLQAALDAERLAQELELRRAEVAKKRPKWMMAVTAIAFVATAGLGWYAVQRQQESETATQNQRVAEADKAKAVADAQEAQRQMDQMSAQLTELDGKVQRALDNLLAADTAAKRAEAKAALQKLQQDQADLRARQRKLEHDRWIKERKGGAHVDDKCLHNAVC